MEMSQEAHLAMAKYILRYLKETMDYGIYHEAHDKGELITFINLDYTRDPDTKKFASNIIHIFGTTLIH